MSEAEKLLEVAAVLLDRIERLLPPADEEPDWQTARAFRWCRSRGRNSLLPIEKPNFLRLEDIRCVERQKCELERNTRQFLHGLPANNALLWGSRGTGKSSLIKALLHHYAHNGLREIQVNKEQLADLPEILERIKHRPEKFILFCDDLSFEAEDPGYKALKAALEGSLYGLPEHVLIYATSNRRHLLPEYHQENLETRHPQGEIHFGEAVEEKISLSDRFGLWLSFHPFNQDQYLEVVDYWLTQLQTPLDPRELIREESLRWALKRGSRSGRTAWQYAKDRAGRVRIEESR
ncbi:MAG: ATP-binding protein [Gammaproteobacteria bacterium]